MFLRYRKSNRDLIEAAQAMDDKTIEIKRLQGEVADLKQRLKECDPVIRDDQIRLLIDQNRRWEEFAQRFDEKFNRIRALLKKLDCYKLGTLDQSQADRMEKMIDEALYILEEDR